MMHNPFKITYRRKPCIRLKGIFGDGGGDYILQQVRRNFFQDVGCDGTDISEDIDLEVQVHIQSIVLILEQFHCYIYV